MQRKTDEQKIVDAEEKIAKAEEQIARQKEVIEKLRQGIRDRELKNAADAGKALLRSYEKIGAGPFDPDEAARIFDYLKSSGYFTVDSAQPAISEDDVDIDPDEEL